MQLGVIGTGNMAAELVRAAEFVPGVTVRAVLSRSQDRASVFCAQHSPTATAFDAMEPFLDVVEAVYIATPPAQHLAAILAALDAGIPVLCEKPFTPSVKDTETVIAKARETGVPVMEAIWTVTLPAYRALKEQLTGLQDPAAHRLTFDFSYPMVAPPTSHFLDPEFGGVLLDRAVYGYGAALFLLGQVSHQQAFIKRDDTGLDRSATLILEHDTGAQTLVTLSFDHMGSNRLDLATSQGVARLGPPSLAAESLQWDPYWPPTQDTGQSKPAGMVQKLKANPTLRKMRRRIEAFRVPFHGYGATPYVSVLEEFHQTVSKGAKESTLVPLALSEQVAILTAQARAE